MNPDAGLQLQPVSPADFEPLLALRIRAMQPSLEALGRFEPARARERFLSSFLPEHMQHIVQGGQRIGCVTLRPKPAALRMDHLYIEPTHQGQGVGAWVMDWACAQADLKQVPLELAALQGSAANRFYMREGFVEVGRSEFDIEYRRVPHASPLAVARELWARFQARDWAAARALVHDQAVVHWWASGETLNGADTFIAANAEYPEGWTIHLLQAAPLQDGRVLTQTRVNHPPLDFLATSLFRVRDGLIRQIDETWSTCEEPPAWRSAQRFPGITRMAGWPAAMTAP
jgi:GNAT superfamily N-acetyltransferase